MPTDASKMDWRKTQPTTIIFKIILLSHTSLCCFSFILVPEQLHCSSDVLYRNMEPNQLDRFSVDEFVDIPMNRSSLKLKNMANHRSKIYYNEILEAQQLNRRKLFTYDIDQSACKSTGISDWPLRNIRRIVIHMLRIDQLSTTLCDIAIGPSAMLLTIKETLDTFRYLSTQDDEQHLLSLDIYESVRGSSIHLQEQLIITVRTLNQDKDENDYKINKTLADIANISNNKRRVQILSVKVCTVKSDVLKSFSADKSQANKEFKCRESEFLFQINYILNALLTSNTGTLIGQDFDNQDESYYDYYKNPFTLPIGTGCWSNTDIENTNQRKSFTFVGTKFSAEYTTTNGTKGLSYVAYDSQSMLLRLDRDERMTIYDLDRGISYNIDEFRSIRELTRSPDVTKKCIVLDTDTDLFKGRSVIERLIGIARGVQAPYLGLKTISHHVYDVFEIELRYSLELGYNLPILLELVKFRMPKSDVANEKRYFVTYYVSSKYNQGSFMTVQQQEQQQQQSGEAILIPKYIELWELDLTNRQKNLLNRLEFNEFSWSLDLSPTDYLSSPDSIHLFNVNSCAQQRAAQLQLRYRVGLEAGGSQVSNEFLSANFKANQRMIKEALLSRVIAALEIPRLNVVQFDVSSIPNSGKLLLQGRIVELISGISHNKLLSITTYEEAMESLKHNVLAYHHNRHSLNPCCLDSLTNPEKNSLMYCEKLALCVIIKLEKVDEFLKQINNDKKPPSTFNQTMTRCELYQFNWVSRPTEEHESIVDQVLDNKYKLSSSRVGIILNYVMPNGEVKTVKYVGSSFGPETKQMDPIGSSSAKLLSLISMRHTTIAEDPLALNLNNVVSLPTSSSSSKFEYCQLACQMDIYCESFSVCSRKKSKSNHNQSNDCILSSFRLTSESIEQLRSISLDANSSGYTTQINQKFSPYSFKLDLDCNLHPKDILFSLRPPKRLATTTTSVEDARRDAANEIDARKSKAPTSSETISVRALEECAELSYRNSIGQIFESSNFVYCHLKSYCILNNADGLKLPSATNGQICYLYSLSHTHFYEYTPFVRLSIINKRPGKDRHQIVDKGDSRRAFHEMRELKLGRLLISVSLDKCAEFCNLHQSKCLAFDSCRPTASTHLCFLYSIRSPRSKFSKRLGLLELEKKFYPSNDGNTSSSPFNKDSRRVSLVTDSDCTHYHLKNIYLEVKLRQMQVDEEIKTVDCDSQREFMNKAEDSLIEDTQKGSDELLKEAAESKEKFLKDLEERSEMSWTANFVFLMLGALIGSVGFLCGNKGIILSAELWETFRRNGWRLCRIDRRTSQISLANGDDL